MTLDLNFYHGSILILKRSNMRFVYLMAPLFLVGCNSDDNDLTPVEVNFVSEFKDDSHNWVAAFSDYPADDAESFQLVSGIENIPGVEGKSGFLLGGMNRSDDLFMYLKKEVTDLVPNTRYLLSAKATFWSHAGNVCFGIGGSPGESVFMKVGASEMEPKQADYYMNIDIGHQSSNGSDALNVGNVAVDGLSCGGFEFAAKEVALTQEQNFEILSSPEGNAWVLVGSDSGYEGLTHLYYESIEVTLTPVQ